MGSMGKASEAPPPPGSFSNVRTSGRSAELFRKREVRLQPQFPRGLGIPTSLLPAGFFSFSVI